MTDEQLAAAARVGDRNAERELVQRFESMARFIASGYFLAGGDRDDLRQEARLGLFKAIRDYNESAGLFAAFARICITRQVITAIKTDTRQKNRPLNTAVRVLAGDEDGDIDAVDLIEAPNADPATLLYDRDRARLVLEVIRTDLTELERASIVGVASGESYREVEQRLIGTPTMKVVDNAVQRAREKIARRLEGDVVPLGVAA